MFVVVYVSAAVVPFSEPQLDALLCVSREVNRRLDVTGMLLYEDGNFMQYLEGSKESVTGLRDKIYADPRHRGIITVVHEERGERQFKDWSMGFKRPDLAAPGLANEQFLDPYKSLELILSFKLSILKDSRM
jgi:hypothetical protein